jgi:hypothetical protein
MTVDFITVFTVSKVVEMLPNLVGHGGYGVRWVGGE